MGVWEMNFPEMTDKHLNEFFDNLEDVQAPALDKYHYWIIMTESNKFVGIVLPEAKLHTMDSYGTFNSFITGEPFLKWYFEKTYRESIHILDCPPKNT